MDLPNVDVPQMTQALQVVAQILPPLLANHPGDNGIPIGINQELQQMRAHLGELRAALDQVLNQMNAGFAGVRDTMEYHNRLGHARSLNSCAVRDISPLHPVPLPNGQLPPPGVFPTTVGHFRRLRGPELTNLIGLYELPHPNLLAERRRVLAEYFTIPR